MQLIALYEVTDFSAWQTAFTADEEARRDAGLSVLQIWRDADNANRAIVLLDVNDRKRADAWITRSNALGSDDANTVNTANHVFLETA